MSSARLLLYLATRAPDSNQEQPHNVSLHEEQPRAQGEADSEGEIDGAGIQGEAELKDHIGIGVSPQQERVGIKASSMPESMRKARCTALKATADSSSRSWT